MKFAERYETDRRTGEVKTHAIEVSTGRMIAYPIIALILLAVLTIGPIAGCKSFSRYQKRADANNNVKVTNINIRKAQQQARIVHAQNAGIQAKAEQRVIEAEGIRKAQDLISKTLTPLYVQHEAIKAQENDRQGDRTYIPVGPQGVPLVANIEGGEVK